MLLLALKLRFDFVFFNDFCNSLKNADNFFSLLIGLTARWVLQTYS